MFALLVLATMTPADQYRQWGIETIEGIRQTMYIEKQRLYAEQIEPGKPPTQPAFAWPAGVMLSALNSAAKVDSKYEAWMRDYADALFAYWRDDKQAPVVEGRRVGGFDVLPLPKTSDRYYDDNAWLVLAFIESSLILKDAKYLDIAEMTFQFVLSGEDRKLGGGLYWHENNRVTKNTCTNAPAAVAALRLFQITKNKAHLNKGRELYEWTKKNLQDPGDGLYWDNIDVRTGAVEKTKWSYNTGLMLTATAEMFKTEQFLEKLGDTSITPDQRRDKLRELRREMNRLRNAAQLRWVQPSGAIACDAAFAHLLHEAFINTYQVTGNADWRSASFSWLNFIRNKNRDSRGHYGKRWETEPKQPYAAGHLIHQASAARAFFVGAEALAPLPKSR
jgi:rhamnogalacturonyl hydrolase YesR